MKRILSLILALLFVFAVFVGCGGNNKPADETTKKAGDNTQGEDETTAKDNENWFVGLDYNGADMIVGVQGGNADYYDNYTIGVDGGDIAWASVYETNLLVSGKLNINLQIVTYAGGQGGSIQTMVKEIAENNSVNDIILPDQYYGTAMVTDGYYLNVKNLDTDNNYLDLDKDCWYADYHANLSPDDKSLYFLAGDISPTILAWCSCTFVDLNLFNDVFGSEEAINEFLDLVENGGWTVDKNREYIEQAYVDLNNNQKVDLEDQLGACTSKGQSGVFACAAAGMTFSQKVDGSIEFTLASERNTDIFMKIFDYYNNTNGFLAYDYSTTPNGNIDTFVDGRALFMNEYFCYAFRPLMREMTNDYVIIPRPKADEQETSYHSSMQDGLKLYSIPVSADPNKYEAITAYLELACELYNKNVIPAMYETSLKIKWASEFIDGDQVSRLIDLVRTGIVSDFAAVYNYALGSVSGTSGSLIQNKQKKWQSYIAMNIKAYQTKLDALLAGFEALANK